MPTVTMGRIVEMINPAFIVAAIIGCVLVIFLTMFYLRVGWERNVYGLRRRWQRHERRKRRKPPEYEPLQHDTHSDQPKPSA